MGEEKKVQVPSSLLVRTQVLVTLLKHDYDMDDDINKLCDLIDADIKAYYERQDRRKMYTQYKTGKTADEREQGRQKYLDAADIHKNWRWSSPAGDTTN